MVDKRGFRMRHAVEWLEARRDRYPYWARPVPTGSVRPERVDCAVTGQHASAVLEVGWRTFAFASTADRDKFETIYRAFLQEPA